MPKCEMCDGTGKETHCLYYGRYIDTRCPSCEGHGWLPFWTPAERAGLRTLGENLRVNMPRHRENGEAWKNCKSCSRDATTIHRFVKAARAAKEGR